jgi:kynurenine formamidase
VTSAASQIAELSGLLRAFKVRDLSHTLEPGIPHFPTHTPFQHLEAKRADDPAVMFRIEMHEHNGTHVDAPAHYIAGGPHRDRDFLHSVDPMHLVGLAAVIHADSFRGSLLPLSWLIDWEAAHGAVGQTDAVIFNFGWHRKWHVGNAGAAFVASWPGLSAELADALLDRGVRAVGTDCLGLDCSGSAEIPAHDRLLRNHILIMENLAHLDGLPPRIFLLAMPLPILNGSGSPIRALALVPRSDP